MRNYLLSALAALALVSVVACGGGGSGPNTPYPAPPSSGGGTLAGATKPTTITMAAGNGLGVGDITVDGTGVVQATQSTSASSSVTPLSKKSLKSAKTVPQGSTDPNTAIAYVTITATATTSINSIGLLDISPANAPPAGPYSLAYWNGTQWVTIPGSSATLKNGVLTVTGGTLNPAISLASGSSLYLVVYTGQIFTTPTPPPPAPVASPSSQTISLRSSGTIVVTSGVGVKITATSSDTNIATVDASQNTGTGTTASFNVFGVNPGTATITFTDPLGHTGTAKVTVSNTLASPAPNQSSANIEIGNAVQLQVTTAAGVKISASSSSSAITVSPASVTADSFGHAVFTVTATSFGQATITFTDQYGGTGTFSAQVSMIKNGAFANGLANWTACSYAHHPLPAPVNPQPSPLTTPSQNPNSTPAPVPSASLPALVTITPAPTPDNPNVTQTTPPMIGPKVALLGTLNAGVTAIPKGEFGICQQVAVPASGGFLSMWVYDGGTGFSFSSNDQEATVLDSSGAAWEAALFSEQNCFAHPPNQAPGMPANGSSSGSSSGCWPAAYGGDGSGPTPPTPIPGQPFKDWVNGGYWLQKGPFDMSPWHGQTITLFLGNFSGFLDADNRYAQFMYVGNVQWLPTNTFPTIAPQAKERVFSIQLRH